MKRDFKENAKAAGGVFLYIAVTGFTFFGIARAFHKGVLNGVASVIFPPYAWYCGVAATWEPPRWKEQWDDSTQVLAVVLLAEANQSPENQVYIDQQVDNLRKWARTLPDDKRDQLRSDAVRYCSQYDDSLQWSFDSVLSSHPIEKYTNSISYPLEPAFERTLEERINAEINENQSVFKSMAKSDSKLEDLKIGMEPFLKTTKGEQELRLKSIFAP